jgi:glycosyltransferase involved in cell wall biosynthesis
LLRVYSNVLIALEDRLIEAYEMKNNPEISIILPCRNEEKALDSCLKQVEETIKSNKLNAEIIVSDSSTDSSPEIAKKHGVILVKHDKEGYGNAYLEAFGYAKGKYIFMADADCTYDFNQIPIFVDSLKKGHDFAIGNRFKGKIDDKAMHWSHKYFGNPVLSSILRLFFRTKIHDVNCGMRAIKKEALERLNLKTEGMEFASEMIVSALRNNLKIEEIPIDYHERKGKSKMKSFRDAWRHFRFMLLYSPFYLFFLPGFFLFAIGLISMLWISSNSPAIFGITFYNYPIFISSLLMIVGYQIVIFAFFAKSYSIAHLNDRSEFVERLNKYINLERGSFLGTILLIGGLAIFTLILIGWIKGGFSPLTQIKTAVIALTLVILGIQTIFSSFMLSIIGIKNR